MFHKMGNCLGAGERLSRITPRIFESSLSHCPVAERQMVVLGKPHHVQIAPAAAAWNAASTPWTHSLWLIKQLQVQADHNLSCGNFV